MLNCPSEVCGYEGELAADLLHDMAVLAKFFHHARSRFIGVYGLPALELRMSANALCNVGILQRSTVGRFDDGYRPAGALLQELGHQR